jgi:protein TonB
MAIRLPMIRAEPRLGWTTLSGSDAAAAPLLVLSRERGWAWRTALALSVLLHAGLAILVGDAVLDARDRAAPPVVEVALVVPAEPEAPPVAPPEPSEVPPAPAASPPAPPPPAVAEPMPEPPTPAPEPKLAPAPPKPAEAPAPAAKRDAPGPPEPATRPQPPAAQTAARPPPVDPAKGVEGTAIPRRTEMGAGATVKAVVVPPPTYPRIAIQLREEGTVVVRIEIDGDGTPTEVSVLKSSGFGSLDQAAVQAAQQIRFSVPKSGGRPIAHTVDVPYIFKLKNASR